MHKMKYYTYGTTFLIIGVFVIIWFIEIIKGDTPVIDKWTQTFTGKFTDTFVYNFFRWITELGSFDTVLGLSVMMVILLWSIYRHYLPAMVFGLAVLTTYFLNTIIKNAVQRDRPSINTLLNAEGFSYPSGHAMISTVCYGLIAYFLIKKIHHPTMQKWILLISTVIIFLIGLSRPFLNVHYASDIITGFFLGAICLYAWITIYKNLTPPLEK